MRFATYHWFHIMCIGMPDPEYQRLSSVDEGSCCGRCFKSDLSFHDASTTSQYSFLHSDSTDSCLLTPTTTTSAESHLSFSLYYSNCCSLLPKLDHLRAHVASETSSVIALGKTWLDQSITDSELFISNYYSVRRDRT